MFLIRVHVVVLFYRSLQFRCIANCIDTTIIQRLIVTSITDIAGRTLSWGSCATIITAGRKLFNRILTASPYVRRKTFEIFYYSHIIFAMAMMGCAFYHSGILVPVLAAVLWWGDLIIRKLYMARFRYPRKASIIQLTDTVVELRIPKSKGFDYNPGQVSEAFLGSYYFDFWQAIRSPMCPLTNNLYLK